MIQQTMIKQFWLMRWFILFFIFTTHHFAFAQGVYTYEQAITVEGEEKTLSLPWAGGLNSGQYSMLDLNADQRQDLLVFDRSSNRLHTFISEGDSYRYAPEYEGYFPEELDRWLLAADYNCDGKKDLFTSTPLGIRVFQNTSSPQGPLSFELAENFIKAEFSSMISNLKVNGSDIPALCDIDEDGDLDILAFGFSGRGAIEFFRNMSMETNGDCEELLYRKESGFWGNFAECDCGKVAFGEQECQTNLGREQHVSGKSLLLFDADGDQDKDVLFGEEYCDTLLFLSNQGAPSEAFFNTFETHFPNPNNPAAMAQFPAAYWEDVDHDGLRDLLIAPNLANNSQNSVDFRHSSWWYKNTGSESAPVFSLRKKDFLQDEMIDLGENAAPLLVDVDGDQDLDIVCGQRGIAHTDGFYAGLTLLENTGSATAPAFRITERDYLQFSELRLQNLVPQLADLNGDGLPELVISGENTLAGRLEVIYFPHQQSRENPYQQSLREQLSSPALPGDDLVLEDVNEDGLTDLIVGKYTGRLEYYENTGNRQMPDFVLKEQNFLGVDNNNQRVSPSVLIADLDNDTQKELILSDNSGLVSVFYDYRQDSVEQQHLRLALADTSRQMYLGRSARITAGDLYNTGNLLLLAGTREGGLQWLKTSETVDQQALEIEISPNPGDELIKISVNKNARLIFFDALGRKISEGNIEKRNDFIIIDARNFSPGLYIVKAFTSNGEQKAKRLIIVN